MEEMWNKLYDSVSIKSRNTDPWGSKLYQWFLWAKNWLVRDMREFSGWWNYILCKLYCNKVDLKGEKTKPCHQGHPYLYLELWRIEGSIMLWQGWPHSCNHWSHRLSKARGVSLLVSFLTWILREIEFESLGEPQGV